jgi:hypothetical protein
VRINSELIVGWAKICPPYDALFEHRDRLAEDFADSPSLKSFFLEVFNECYSKARQKAAIETELPIELFPVESPFTPEETLNPEYLPD